MAQRALHSKFVQCARLVFDLDVVDGLRNAIFHIIHGIAVHLCQVSARNVATLIPCNDHFIFKFHYLLSLKFADIQMQPKRYIVRFLAYSPQLC